MGNVTHVDLSENYRSPGLEVISVILGLGKRTMLQFQLQCRNMYLCSKATKIVSEYDQEIPQSQTADKPMAPRGRATQHHKTPGRQTKQSNQPSRLHREDCKTRMDTK